MVTFHLSTVGLYTLFLRPEKFVCDPRHVKLLVTVNGTGHSVNNRPVVETRETVRRRDPVEVPFSVPETNLHTNTFVYSPILFTCSSM